MSAGITTLRSAFGPIVSGADAEDYLQAVLERWFLTYLYELERLHQVEPGTLPGPRSYVRSSEIQKMPEDQLPAVMIGSPGIFEPPWPDGAGYYNASWQVHLGVQIAAGPNRRALELARWYTAAARACVIQQQQDPAIATALKVVRIDWMSERYDVLDSADDRTICIGVAEVALTAAEVLQRGAGPLDPIIPPQAPDPASPTWPLASVVLVDTDKDPA